ncbi:MAG: hypothetical protein ABSG25_07150 [Bryobacteraceae bacterium]
MGSIEKKPNGFDIKVKLNDNGILVILKTGKNEEQNKDVFAEKSEKGIELCLSEIRNYLNNKVVF